MLTTETRKPPSVVARAAVFAVLAGALLTALGGLVSGEAAAAGAMLGSVIAVGIFAFGTFALDAVSRVMPSAALLFALVTYTLQVVLMAMAFVVLNRSGLLDGDVDRNWLGGAIIAVTVVWLVVQVRLATTARIPAFESVPEKPVAEPVSTAAEGGAR